MMKAFTSGFSAAMFHHPSSTVQLLSQFQHASPASSGNIDMSNLRRSVRRIHHFLHVFAGAVTPDHANELFDVVSAKCEHRHTGLFVELRRAIVIGSLGYVVKLMLNQRAEFEVTALLAVVSCQGDDELRYASEPFMHLLFHTGFLPSSGTEHYLLALAEDITALLLECARRPHKRNITVSECINEMFVVRVMEPTFFREDVLIYPLSDFRGRDNPRIRQPVFASEVDGSEWSAVFNFSHTEHSSGLLEYLPGNYLTGCR
nr:MAG TPA: hypothetical protein [Caudoviricetes sp.]